MARKSSHNRSSKNQGGSRYAALAILTLILLAVGGYLLFKPDKRVSPPAPPKQSAVRAPIPVTPATPRPPVVHNYSSVHKTLPALPRYPHSKAQLADRPTAGTLPAGSGQLAIIIDDMGSSMQEARSLAGIDVTLTFSIIPGLRSYREVAAFAGSQGIETMIHIPMQSKGWPARRLESNGLLVSMDDAAVNERLEEFMRNLPKAVGANNHMGSEFTEHEDKMRSVLTTLKGRGLFFVDSVTSPRTVGMRLAQELGVKSGRRSVFLDNEQDGAYIRGQLDQAVRLAKKNGGVIAICHPHPVTIQTLKSQLPTLAKQGITLVPASRLVR